MAVSIVGVLVCPNPVTAIGVSFALARTSNQISCDLTADGQIIAGSCLNVDSSVRPAISAILIIALVIPPIAGAYLYWVAGLQADVL